MLLICLPLWVYFYKFDSLALVYTVLVVVGGGIPKVAVALVSWFARAEVGADGSKR